MVVSVDVCRVPARLDRRIYSLEKRVSETRPLTAVDSTYGVHPNQQDFYTESKEHPARPSGDIGTIEQSGNHDGSDSHSL